MKLEPRICHFEETSAYFGRPKGCRVCRGCQGPSLAWLQVSSGAICRSEGLDAFHVLPSGAAGTSLLEGPGRLELHPVGALPSSDGRVI